MGIKTRKALPLSPLPFCYPSIPRLIWTRKGYGLPITQKS